MSDQALLGAAMVASALPLAWWAVAGERATSKAVAANLRRGLGGADTDLRRAALTRSGGDRAVQPVVHALAARARRLAPGAMLSGLERQLVIAGLQRRWPIERILAAKLVLAFVVALLGALRLAATPSAGVALVSAASTLGAWFLPDVIVRGRARERQQVIRRALPDTLDQLTITVEAGLGFEAALARTARAGAGPLAEELLRTIQDLQLGSSRDGALGAFAARLDVPEVRRVVNALRQADRFGVPVAQVLRIESDEMRDRRRQEAEEKAMKLPVKVLFPLMLCILPTLFIVILGPVAAQFLG